MESNRPDSSPLEDDSGNFDGSLDYTYPEVSLPFWAYVLGVTPSTVRMRTQHTVRQCSQQFKRTLSQEEVEAMCDLNRSKSLITAWHLPLQVPLAVWLWRRGRSTLRFPFWQPKFVKTSPRAFPTVAAPWIEGEGAARLWDTARGLAYFVSTYLGVGVGLSVYADVQGTAFLKNDPRLTSFVADMMHERLPETIQRRKSEISRRLAREASRSSKERLVALRDKTQADLDEFEQQSRERTGKFARMGDNEIEWTVAGSTELLHFTLQEIDKAIAAKEGSTDTSRHQPDQESELAALRGDGGLATSDSTSSAGVVAYQAQAPRSQPGWGKPPDEVPAVQSWGKADSDGLDDDDDDASPIARSARRASSSNASGGSAWDRIRQQAQAEQKQGRASSSSPQSSASTWGEQANSSGTGTSNDRFS